VKFDWMHRHRGRYPLAMMCRLLRVSRSGYYAWRPRKDRPPSPTARRRTELTEQVRTAHADSRGIYGSPRVHRELRARGVACCENTVAKIMRQNHLRSRCFRKFRPRTTDSTHGRAVAENVLDRRFDLAHAGRPDRAWVGDITYIPTAEGWLYLAVVIDLYSRRVIGWAMADHLKASLAIDALTMALDQRRAAGADLSGLLHHSDRGVQYVSGPYQAMLEASGAVGSMSRKGNCYDNAVAESFFGSLKTEWTEHENYRSREQAEQSIFEYVEVFYNRQRRHSSLGYVSPCAYELAA
jgi:transposase InsO family protein